MIEQRQSRPDEAQSAANLLRVSTLNLDHFPDDRHTRLLAAAAAVKSSRSDVILVQEVTEVDGSDTATMLAELTGTKVVASSPHGNAILTALPSHGAEVIDLGASDAAAVVVDTGCHSFLMVSTHLIWGSGREHFRLSQAMDLDTWVASRAPYEPHRSEVELYAVLGGDLNSEPGTATIRWLQGLDVHEGSSTLWVDAWRVGEGGGSTSTPENPFASRTAAMVQISYPDLLPARRIDYIMTRGYAYGRVGAAVSSKLIGMETLAFGDHYGLSVELLC
jgi:endonuclease/exonuclease/phosphatase family metal-dependent hydrolase